MFIRSNSLNLIQHDMYKYYYDLPANSVQEDELSTIGLTGTVKHFINNDGLDARQNYTVQKPTRTFRIINMGDSFAQGAFVGTENTYSSQLEDMLNQQTVCVDIDRFEVINLGVSGYDMQYSVERFKEKGLKYDPDMIIFWILDNDFLSHNEKYSAIYYKWKELLNRNNASNNEETMFIYPDPNLVFDELHRTYSDQQLIFEEMQFFREFLRLFNKPVLIFTIKSFPQLIKQQIYYEIFPFSNVRFQTDIPDTYSKLPDSHPSTQGHKEFANYLYKQLLQYYLPHCKEK